MCEPLMMTVKEAARRLAMGRSATYKFIQTGELPSVKLGGARRILLTDLQEFVRRMREEAAP